MPDRLLERLYGRSCSSEVKAVLNKKKREFRKKDTEELRNVQNEIGLYVRGAKEAYRLKLEE